MSSKPQDLGNVQAYSESTQGVGGSGANQLDEHFLSTEVKRYVDGVRYPANKNDLIEHAVERQAPNRIVNVLQQLPPRDAGSPNATKPTVYSSVDDLIREIEKIGVGILPQVLLMKGGEWLVVRHSSPFHFEAKFTG